MDILVLNTEFEQTYILDSYESFIWTDRYYGYGDFEIYVPFNSTILNYVRQDYYLQIADSEHTMIVESIKIQTDADNGNHIIITGRSLESILERRVIWPMAEFGGDLQTNIFNMLNDAFIDPTQKKFGDKTYIKRKVDNFKFISNPDIVLEIEPVEITGDVIYDVILDWCQSNEIGFKIILRDIEINNVLYKNQFVFSLYEGTNRSLDQVELEWVIFSKDFDNIISTDYIDNISPWRNFAIVAGEGEGESRKFIAYGDLEKESGTNKYKTVGINHRELYVDARDIQSEELEDTSYEDAMAIRGAEKLNECLKDIEFSGEVEAKRKFVYGRDFYMGDIVQIVNEYGIEGKARVVEYIHNDTDSGTEVYPTFEAIQDYNYSYEKSET